MTTIVTIDMGGTGATHAAGARSALSAAHENAYAQANAAYEKANTASSTGGGGYDQANAAYTQANSARSDANTTFETVNTTFLTINTTFGTINTSLSTMNLNLSGAQAWSNIVSFAAYGQANTARSDANTTFTTINTTFATVNTTFGTINTNYQAAYAQANAAYAAANNSNLLSGGLVSGTLNVTQDLIVGGNIYLEGNTTYINVATYSIEDSLVYYASNNKLTDSVDIGFMGGKNTGGTYAHTGLARDATDGKWKLFDGLAEEGHVGNVVDFANTYLATLVANVEANTLTVLNGVSGNVNFDSGTLFVDSVGNSVGIGITSPIFPLQVKTNTGTPPQALQLNTTDWTTTIGSSFQFGFGAATGNTYSEIRALSSGYNAWNNLVLQSGGGNVGIGTTSPSSPLHVVTGSADSDGFNLETTGSGGKTFFAVHKLGFIRIRSSDTNGAAMHMYDNAGSKKAEFSIGSDSKLNWYSDALTSTWLTFDGGNGRVGIGTTSPSRKLHVTTTGADIATFNGANTGFVIQDNGSGLNQVELVGYRDDDSSYNDILIRGSAVGLFINGTTGNVGIGTTSSSVWFEVNRSGVGNGGAQEIARYVNTASGAYSGFLYIGSSSGVDWKIGKNVPGTSSRVNFDIADNANSVKLTIDSSGNVAIGTTIPLTLFHVSGSSQNVRFSNFSTDSAGLLISYQNSNTHGLHLMYRPSDATCYIDSTYQANAGTVYGDIYFRQNVAGTMTPRMTIKADGGKVGINTTSPAVGLVVADATANDGSDNIGIFYKGTSGNHESGINWYDFRGQVNAKIVNILINDGVNTPQAHLDFRATNGSTTLNTVMRLFGNGNVGIGTTNPSYPLHVVGKIYSTTQMQAGAGIVGDISHLGTAYAGFGSNSSTKGIWLARDFANTYPDIVISSAGNVGIGTPSPATKLNVLVGAGTANGTVGIRIGGVNNYESLELGILDNYSGMIRSYGSDLHYYSGHWRTVGLTSSENHSHYWYTSKNGSADWSTAKMILNHDGYLGIGTTSPSKNLHIYTSGNEGLYVQGTGSGVWIDIKSGSSELWSMGADSSGWGIYNRTDTAYRLVVENDGHLRPGADNALNLGTTSFRWANIYTADLNLSNRDSKNDVDGTWGEWTIQEGEEDLFLLNRRNGKKYKFMLKEIE